VVSAFALKLLALAAMAVDHLGVALNPVTDASLLSGIGRMAFPIYVFFLAEGCRRTRNIAKYCLRLALFAFISEVPYDLFSGNIHRGYGLSNMQILDFSSQNVFFTLALGALAIIIAQKIKKGPMALIVPLAVAAVIVLGYLIQSDYGAAGVLFIFLVWAVGPRDLDKPQDGWLNAGRLRQAGVLVALSAYFYLWKFMNLLTMRMAFFTAENVTLLSRIRQTVTVAFRSLSDYAILLFIFGCVPALLILFYNGKRGPSLKWAFYAFYPLHQLAYAALWLFVIQPGKWWF
jgi:hypothetical protein